ncbi:hypothetical protein AN403_6186 [Pseudomonas fluorescens]|jgi:hypothetical protein|uniref:Uncharacterized protein n=1 Tax=Pseudomonas fluorescens TaxID=294 RepID=A0A0N8NY57_PSEFL|nr:hypothetical protein AN403_6186 [Pseudomonas fluorescens]
MLLLITHAQGSMPARGRSVFVLLAALISIALPRHAASYPLPVRQASDLPRASFRLAVARETLASG